MITARLFGPSYPKNFLSGKLAELFQQNMFKVRIQNMIQDAGV